MSLDESDFFSREELLEGLPSKRAKALLFAIENWTASMEAQSPRAMDFFLTQKAEEERDLAFLEAFSLGREPRLRPKIQDLEHHADKWAFLVPKNSRMRAAVAYMLGQKYRFTHQDIPHIRKALGLDEEPVQQAYRRLYHQELETIFTTRGGQIDRLRWAWKRLERG